MKSKIKARGLTSFRRSTRFGVPISQLLFENVQLCEPCYDVSHLMKLQSENLLNKKRISQWFEKNREHY